MADAYKLRDGATRHEAERSSRELECIDVIPHVFENVLKLTLAKRCVVRSSYFGDAARTGFGIALIALQKRKSRFINLFLGLHWHPVLSSIPCGVLRIRVTHYLHLLQESRQVFYLD